MSKINALLQKCGYFEKLASGIRAYRSGDSSDFHSATQGSLGAGYYFTTNIDRARHYADFDGCIVWVDINLSNPLVGDKRTIAEKINLLYHFDDDTGSYDSTVGKNLSQLAKEKGHDGIIAKESNGTFYEIVVFDKSAVTFIKKDCVSKV